MKNLSILGICLLFIITIVSCDEYEDPPLIWDPNQSEGTQSPVIDSVTPSDSAIAGVREIQIQGENLVSDSGTVQVFFSGQQAYIKTATQNQVVVHRPAIAGSDLFISLSVQNALSVAQFEGYSILETWQPLRDPDDLTDIIYSIYGLEVDSDENLYIASRSVIFQLPRNGDLSVYQELENNDLRNISDIKIGPDGYLYISCTRREIYRVPPGGGASAEEEFVSLSERVSKIDFDENYNLFAARRDGIFIVDPNGQGTHTDQYREDFDIIQLKVYNGYLYVGAEYDGENSAYPSIGIFRNEILDVNGNLGEPEVIFDWNVSPEFGDSDLSGFTMADDGTIYANSSNNDRYPILVVEPDGTSAPFYFDETILPTVCDNIIFGNGMDAYVSRGNTVGEPDSLRIYKMGMAKEGAPYYGRN